MKSLFTRGLLVALAIAGPAAIVANVIAELTHLAPGPSALLMLVVIFGTVIGGTVVGQADPPNAVPLSALVGVVAFAVIGSLSYLRRAISGEDVKPALILAFMVIGALFSTIGGAIGQARAGRTRR